LVVLNRVARVLATSPDASLRNGAEAVVVAERAAGLTGGREPTILETLAAAYAEVGRFAQAVETARRALSLATREDEQPLAAGLRASIALYEARAASQKTP
jgi:Flp pilus assembly protein TadD